MKTYTVAVNMNNNLIEENIKKVKGSIAWRYVFRGYIKKVCCLLQAL